MRFHILTPVLNGARFLNASILSIREQTWTDWKMTILDAGSADGSIDIARHHANEDSRITLKVGPDNGQYDALRKGFDVATGDVLSWLNCDDLYTPWALETVAEILSAGRKRWVTGLPAHWDEQGRLVAVLPAGATHRYFIRHGWRHDRLLGCIQQESSFFAADLWHELTEAQKSRFAALQLAGDFYLWKCFSDHASLAAIPSVLGGFRVHGQNRSRLLAEGYHREALECGAFSPAGFIARPIRGLHDHFSAIIALRNFRIAARRLHAASEAGS
jgi:glycosyltransferase involved in cell wall biosynthesis